MPDHGPRLIYSYRSNTRSFPLIAVAQRCLTEIEKVGTSWIPTRQNKQLPYPAGLMVRGEGRLIRRTRNPPRGLVWRPTPHGGERADTVRPVDTFGGRTSIGYALGSPSHALVMDRTCTRAPGGPECRKGRYAVRGDPLECALRASGRILDARSVWGSDRRAEASFQSATVVAAARNPPGDKWITRWVAESQLLLTTHRRRDSWPRPHMAGRGFRSCARHNIGTRHAPAIRSFCTEASEMLEPWALSRCRSRSSMCRSGGGTGAHCAQARELAVVAGGGYFWLARDAEDPWVAAGERPPGSPVLPDAEHGQRRQLWPETCVMGT